LSSPALAAALGPASDAVVYAGHDQAVADAPEAAGATLAVAEEHQGRGFVLPGERTLLSVVHPERRAAAAVASALRHVYLAADPAEALAKHRRHPGASFVTREGVLVGPAVVRTAPAPSEEELEAVEGVGEARAREIREGLRRLQEVDIVDRYP
jgi:chromosome segregation ATPase